MFRRVHLKFEPDGSPTAMTAKLERLLFGPPFHSAALMSRVQELVVSSNIDTDSMRVNAHSQILLGLLLNHVGVLPGGHSQLTSLSYVPPFLHLPRLVLTS